MLNFAPVEYRVQPIGRVRSPLTEKARAPRQSRVATGLEGRIEVFARHEHALCDLAGFERLWVLFWFDRAQPGPSKVLPPRSDVKRGVFATRSPHRPNPIGLSAVRLVRVEGLTLFVRDLDILDDTPVLDIKPYLPYADAFPDARTGWLEAPDPVPAWRVELSDIAERQLSWIAVHDGGELRARILETLALGPQPHPYRRIRRLDDRRFLLAVKDWRIGFIALESAIMVERVDTGYRPRQLAEATSDPIAIHRQFAELFG